MGLIIAPTRARANQLIIILGRLVMSKQTLSPFRIPRSNKALANALTSASNSRYVRFTSLKITASFSGYRSAVFDNISAYECDGYCNDGRKSSVCICDLLLDTEEGVSVISLLSPLMSQLSPINHVAMARNVVAPPCGRQVPHRRPCRSRFIALTADLSAFRGFHGIPLNLLNFIIGPRCMFPYPDE